MPIAMPPGPAPMTPTRGFLAGSAIISNVTDERSYVNSRPSGPAERPVQCQGLLGVRVPALRGELTGMQIALHAHLVAARLARQQSADRQCGDRHVVAAQRCDVEKPCPPALFDMSLAAEGILGVGVRVTGQPERHPA